MTAATAVPRRVVDCYRVQMPMAPDYFCLVFECGHLDVSDTLPRGHRTTESVADAIFGCEDCAYEAENSAYIPEQPGVFRPGEPPCATKAEFGYCRCSDVRACND